MRRMASIAALIVALWPVAAAAGEKLLPADVASFIDRRELCELFRGEEPRDAERRRFVGDAVAKLCAGSDAELKKLREKYRRDPDVLEKLKDYVDLGEMTR